jgi:hypothetical protein
MGARRAPVARKADELEQAVEHLRGRASYAAASPPTSEARGDRPLVDEATGAAGQVDILVTTPGATGRRRRGLPARRVDRSWSA